MKLFCRLSLVLTMMLLAVACDEDEAPTSTTDPNAPRASISGALVYTWLDIELSNFPANVTLELRRDYWSTTELTADPSGSVVATAPTTYRLQFTNLSAGIFGQPVASIRLVVKDSVGDDLQGIVVLCDETGPFSISNKCQGDCDPLCGIDDCHGCTTLDC